MTAINNSRMGRVLPDVEPEPSPLIDRLLALTDRFGQRDIDVASFQKAVRATLAQHVADLERPVKEALRQRVDRPIARKTWPSRDYTIQIIYIKPHEVHPCHHHHNVVSTQMVLAGQVFGREYERVARRPDGTLLLRPLTEGWFGRGDSLQSSEMSSNAHWFAAGDEPAAMFNFNIRGYEDETFDPRDGRPLGRRLLDATLGAAGDGLILAREIDAAEAYERFGDRPLDAFPLPVAAPHGPQRLAAAQ